MANWQLIGFCIGILTFGTVEAQNSDEQKNAAEPQESIELAFGQTGYDFIPLFDKFHQQTGITIITAPPEQYDLKAELIKASDSKKLPDAIIAPADYTTIQSVTFQTITEEWLNPDISQAALQTVSYQNKVNAIPLVSGNHLLLYYNRKFIEKPAKTITELFSHLNKIPENTRLISWDFTSMYNFIPFLHAFDASPITDNQLTLNTPQMASALEFYWSLTEQGLLTPNCGCECNTTGFKNEEFAYVISGVWSFKDYYESLGDKLGIALLPDANGKPLMPYFSSHVLAIPLKERTQKKRQALIQFSQFLQSEYAQNRLWNESRALPSNTTVMNKILQNADENTLAMMAQLDYAVPIPNTPHMTIVWEALLKGFNRYGANIMSAQEAAELMQHLAERTLENQ